MALKSGTSLKSPSQAASSSVALDPPAPPHSPSRIADFEASERAFELNLEISVLEFSITWCSQMLLNLHAKIWPFIGTSETGWPASEAGALAYIHMTQFNCEVIPMMIYLKLNAEDMGQQWTALLDKLSDVAEIQVRSHRRRLKTYFYIHFLAFH